MLVILRTPGQWEHFVTNHIWQHAALWRRFPRLYQYLVGTGWYRGGWGERGVKEGEEPRGAGPQQVEGDGTMSDMSDSHLRLATMCTIIKIILCFLQIDFECWNGLIGNLSNNVVRYHIKIYLIRYPLIKVTYVGRRKHKRKENRFPRLLETEPTYTVVLALEQSGCRWPQK